ncbi:MAG: acetyl-CoA carboxylase, carboxyltransferase subunit beta [Holosporales bacterium]|jgi:acetyl-CoA carboxylase carboxyl transferase subunit beta|nr:acetyl-CoA carboxylase, carboxyltransferase subunit beta [Holosporales bacterium]
MSWLKDFVTPKIKAIIGGTSNDEAVSWTKCPSCEKLIYNAELAENYMVCNNCNHHFQISGKARFALVFDDQKYTEIPTVKIKDDPIKFRDTKKYHDRLKEARQATGDQDAILVACGNIGNLPAVVFSMNFAFMGGSMGLAVGKTISLAAETAIKNRAALIGFTASGGARMQEGMFSLMQMPATIASICTLKEYGLPYINVFTHPTTGGVLASFAMLGDIHISEPNALIGFAGARVIEKTIKHKLPDGFQRSEFLKDHGMIDMIVSRGNIPEILRGVLDYTIGGLYH